MRIAEGGLVIEWCFAMDSAASTTGGTPVPRWLNPYSTGELSAFCSERDELPQFSIIVPKFPLKALQQSFELQPQCRAISYH